MSQYFALFQIGPVQEFIQTARKTQDFWSGSFLLSFLNAVAISSFNENPESDIIFPNMEKSGIFEASVKLPIPWPRTQLDKYYIPSLPNRFFAKSTSDPSTSLKRAKDEVLLKWESIAGEVKKSLIDKARCLNLDISIWDDQIKNRSFEILYIWTKVQNGEGSQIDYKKIETLLGLRKMTRLFEKNLINQEGYACSLCGLRSSLSPKGVDRKGLRKWWQDVIREERAFRHRIRKDEHLCAVCTVKRLAPEFVFKAKLEVPSTSTMAVTGFQKRLRALYINSNLTPAEKIDVDSKIDILLGEVERAAVAIDEPEETKLPPNLSDRSYVHPWQMKIDGDWFFDSFYDHPDRKEKTKGARKALQDFLKEIKAIDETIAPPSKYYALLAADGDNMGKTLAAIKDYSVHRKFSKLLADFALDHAHYVLEEQHSGYILYWGGDEGVAMLCLEDLLSAIEKLQKIWKIEVQNKFQEEGIQGPTLSIGAVIAHHQSPLRSVIHEVFSALEAAKKMGSPRPTKDAWAVKILRRGGAPLTARARFNNDNGFDTLDHLGKHLEAYKDQWLSPRWLADLEGETAALGDCKEDRDPSPSLSKEDWWKNARNLFDLEAPRLIKRHSDVKPNSSEEELLNRIISGLKKMNERISGVPPNRNYQRFQDLLALMNMAHYIAKGGGK